MSTILKLFYMVVRAATIVKARVLLLIILLAVGSVAGYLFLTEKIVAAEKQIAEGQIKVEKEQLALDKGQAKLEAGKRKMSEGKEKYEQAKNNLFLVLADKLLKGGKGFKSARERIAEGDERIAKGENKVNIGEGKLDAGKLKLKRGRDLLRTARGAQIACAIGAAFFAVISIVLGFYWRHSLAQIFKRTAT